MVSPAPSPANVRVRGFEHWLVLALIVGALLVEVVLAVAIEPDPRGFGTHEKLGLPTCKPMEWWNVPCPGCGVTTSISLAGHGRFLASLHNQPFGFLVALAIPLVAAWAITATLRGRDVARELTSLRVGRWWIVVIVLAVIGWAWKLALVRGWVH